jgi:hypothetical protein
MKTFFHDLRAHKSSSKNSPVSHKARLNLENLEDRLAPASIALHAAGNQLQDSAGHPVVLRGVDLSGLESYPTGLTGDASQVLRSVDVALNDWHANLLRLTVYPDFWFGHDQGVGLGAAADGGAAYRDLVDQIIGKAQADNANVMLAVWGSDMGHPGAAPALHDMPDNGTTQFWTDATYGAARIYANNAAVLFDPFNEPHDVSWAQWRNGGTINDNGTTYNSPGMQELLSSIRSTGATNLVAAEGLGWSSDASGVAQGYALNDSAGNLMYQFHFYPAEWQSAADGDALLQPVAAQYPVYIGEFGTPRDANGDGADVNGVPQPDAPTWTANMLAWLNQHQYSWSAWSFAPNTPPSLISDWNYTPTDYFGAYVKNALAQQQQPNNPVVPGNDNFANSTVITGSSATATGSNVNATKEGGEPNIAGNAGGKSVWWTWTAPASGSATVSTAGSNFDTTLGIYTGSSVAALTLVASNDDAPGVHTSLVTFNAIAGTTYQIAVDGYDGVTGNVTLNIALTPSGPANNNFANRTPITGSSATVTGNNVNATKEAGEPGIAGNAGGKSVWWTWTAPASGSATISTAGSNFDTILGVYTGSSAAALTLIANNDDASGGQTSLVTFNAVAGTTYQIAVDGYNGVSGNITLNIALAPSGPTNNNFASRTVITGSSATVTGSNVNATKEAGEPNIAGNTGGKSVWWTWTAPASGKVTISTAGSNFDTTSGIYTGSSVAALTLVASNDDAPGVHTSLVTFIAVAGTTYQIAVDGYNGAAGNITLNVALTPSGPANNNFANRTVITGSSATVTGSNVNATKEAGEPNIAGNAGGKSVWWTWTAPASGKVTISTAGSNFDTTLGIYTGSAAAALTLVASNDDAPGVRTSLVTFNAVAGVTYQIAVDGYNAVTGNIVLSIR